MAFHEAVDTRAGSPSADFTLGFILVGVAERSAEEAVGLGACHRRS